MSVNLWIVLLIATSLLKQLTKLLEILESTEASSACYYLINFCNTKISVSQAV